LHEPYRWERKAEAFALEHGHPRRVFCSSLADVFDNEVDDKWRLDALATMAATPSLRWEICTKRVSNVRKMVPWAPLPSIAAVTRGASLEASAPMVEVRRPWPWNVGLLITTVTPEEITRDVPRLCELKHDFGIPWVGLSIEPMIADVAEALRSLGADLLELDWIILGGESGPGARACDIRWMREVIHWVRGLGLKVFVKQMGDKPTYGGAPLSFTGKGKDPAEWPGDLRVQDFPAALS
jgi:protein gp37